MEWTPEALNAELAYRRGDVVAKRHLVEARRTQPPRWWQRLRVNRPDESDNGERRAA